MAELLSVQVRKLNSFFGGKYVNKSGQSIHVLSAVKTKDNPDQYKSNVVKSMQFEGIRVLSKSVTLLGVINTFLA